LHKFIEIFLYLFFQIWPVLAVAIVLGSLIAAFLPRKTFLDICEGRHWIKAVFLASLAGVISPLGSYAVIPIFTALITSRAIPLAPLMAFLISSPLISPGDFLTTWGLLGSEFALARLISTLLIGNAFGALIHFLDRKGFLEYPGGHEENTKTADTMVVTASTLSPSRWGAIGYYLWKTSKYTAKYFFLSLVLAGLTNTFIPQDWIVRALGGSDYSILLAAAMGLPLYMCGGGAVTLIWQLMQMGMDQGAALAFFIAGPATRIAPLITVWVLVKQRLLFLYFAMSFASAIVLGYLYQWLRSLN
jgi:uncharacterized membrane protein YraQ (UPF0718 family)